MSIASVCVAEINSVVSVCITSTWLCDIHLHTHFNTNNNNSSGCFSLCGRRSTEQDHVALIQSYVVQIISDVLCLECGRM